MDRAALKARYSPLLLRAAHEAVHVHQSASTPSPSTASALTPTEAAATKKKIAATRRRRSKIRVQEEKLESVMEKGSERRMIRVEDVEKEPPKVPEAAVTLLKRVPQLTINGVKVVAHALQVLVTDPAAVKAWLVEMKGKAKHELDHYWLGTKLLYADVSTSTRVLRRLLNATHSRVASDWEGGVGSMLGKTLSATGSSSSMNGNAALPILQGPPTNTTRSASPPTKSGSSSST
ncbi:hypothetical protein PR002_g24685 [Phytophthora rubi]|uniref:Uncharacterized protein n=1 Tax=Phytophthora rubi TaxID=129364 RepID=A0A6A3IEN6_9STRA|nr:hypothetical protein PR002_g24685 [Phytophthora rubi]